MQSDTQRNCQPGISLDVWSLTDFLLKTRLMQALEAGVSRYPVHRTLRFAARREQEALFDDFALNLGWAAQRVGAHTVILDAPGLFITAEGSRKADYCSCRFNIWAESIDRAETAKQKVLSLVEAQRIREPMFSIDWHFLTGKNELESASIEEMADDVLHDEAYPEIKGGVQDFVARYIAAPETVLVLQGPPGTGKTRLIRAILGALSRRNGGEAQALYTGDKRALENDEIYVKFITGYDDAFVVEDADHLLRPRAEGNEHLHRFLAIADGVVRAQGRKIIFSTNLPNIGDLDDALIRPGRCFALIQARELYWRETERLVANLAGQQTQMERTLAALRAVNHETHALAAIYKALAA